MKSVPAVSTCVHHLLVSPGNSFRCHFHCTSSVSVFGCFFSLCNTAACMFPNWWRWFLYLLVLCVFTSVFFFKVAAHWALRATAEFHSLPFYWGGRRNFKTCGFKYNQNYLFVSAFTDQVCPTDSFQSEYFLTVFSEVAYVVVPYPVSLKGETKTASLVAGLVLWFWWKEPHIIIRLILMLKSLCFSSRWNWFGYIQ